MSPSCFGLPGLTVSPAFLVDLGFQPRRLLREFAREPREHVAVDGNAAALHARQHGNERPLQRLVDREHAFGDKPRLEREREPQDDIGPLGGIFGGTLDRNRIEGDPGLAGLDQRVEVDGAMIECVLGERGQRVARASGVERIRHQHHVVIGRDLDAAQRENLPGEFNVVPDLERARVGEQWLERLERGAFGNLIGQHVAAEQAAALAVAALPV